LPYFNYLLSVSNLIIENNGSTDEAIAGLLHDICEFKNGKTKMIIIKNRFGSKVLNIIKQCSDSESEEMNQIDWTEKKKKFIDSMQKKSQSSLLVCICDKLHSMNCIINDHNKIGKKLWKNYHISPDEINWYYKNLCRNFKKFLKNHKTLKDKFQRNVNELGYFVTK
jgi:(p)ppGpp synthase/HD superfamily hydrolase